MERSQGRRREEDGKVASGCRGMREREEGERSRREIEDEGRVESR